MSDLTRAEAIEELKEMRTDAWTDTRQMKALEMAVNSMSNIDRLYGWINDMRLGIAPDENTPEDECRVRQAQIDVIDDIMDWILKRQI